MKAPGAVGGGRSRRAFGSWWPVARREVGERRSVLAVALLLGALVPFLPWLLASPAPAREVRGLYVALGLLAFVPAIAIVAGASVLVPDLVSRRLGFYYSRPLTGAEVVLGKLAGALLLALLAAALVAAPGLVAGADFRHAVHPSWDRPAAYLALGLGVVLVVPLAHALALAFGLRSRWLVADVAGALASLLVTALTGRWLIAHEAAHTFRLGLLAVILAFVSALLVAGVVSLIAGRTDAARVRRWLSSIVAGTALASALGLAAYAAWMGGAGPDDLEWIGSAVAPHRGRWIFAWGGARGGVGGYLFESETGKYLRLPPLADLQFSGDGKQAVLHEATSWTWDERSGPRTGGGEVTRVALEEEDPRRIGTGIEFPRSARLALDPGGRRLASYAGGTLAVHDLEARRLLASVAVRPEGDDGSRWHSALRFPAPGRVRLYLTGSGGVEIRELDVDARRLETTGVARPGPGSYQVSPDGDRLLLSAVGDSGCETISLHDGKSGELLASLASGDSLPAHRRRVRFLADGRIAVGELRGESGWLLVFAPDGAPLADLGVCDLGRRRSPGSLAVGLEPGPGRLTVACGRMDEVTSRLVLVDLRSGESRVAARGLWPAAVFSEVPVTPGDLASRLFLVAAPLGEFPELVELDPATGARRTLLPAGAR